MFDSYIILVNFILPALGMKRSSQILLRFCIDEVGHIFHLYLFVFRGLYEIARRCIIKVNEYSLCSSGVMLTDSIATDLVYRFFINDTGAALTSTTLRQWVTEFLQEHINGFRLGRLTFSDRRTILQALINHYLKVDGKLASLMQSFDLQQPLVKGFIEDCGHSSRAAHEGYLQTSAKNYLGCKFAMSGQTAEIAMARQQVFALYHCFTSWRAVPPGGTNYLKNIKCLKESGNLFRLRGHLEREKIDDTFDEAQKDARMISIESLDNSEVISRTHVFLAMFILLYLIFFKKNIIYFRRR